MKDLANSCRIVSMFTAVLKKNQNNKQIQNTKYQPKTNPLQYKKSHIYIEISNRYQWHRNCLVTLHQPSELG